MITCDLQINLSLTSEEEVACTIIEQALSAAADLEGLPDLEVSVVIVDQDEIQKLNHQYRNIDKPTDVLSFPIWDDQQEFLVYAGDALVPLGDIFISLPQAKLQASLYDHSLERELCFLAVHGFLHLIGYDHQTEESEAIMNYKQEQALVKIGLNR